MNDPDPIPPGFDLSEWQSKPTATAAGWEPVKSDDAGNVWEWSYRDGQGTRIIVGPVERLYIDRLHKRIEELEAALNDKRQDDESRD